MGDLEPGVAVVVDAPPPPLRAKRSRRPRFGDDGRHGAVVRAIVYGLLLTITFGVAYGVTLPGATLCAFQIVSGRPCPGCGMTRSIVNLAHGELLTSLRFHPIGILLFAALTSSFVSAVVAVRTGRDAAWRFLNRFGTRAALVFLVLLVAVWAVRGFLVPDWSPDPIGPGIWSQAANAASLGR